MLTDQARAILRDRAIAHVGLVDARGRPHVTPVWIDVDDQDRLVINTAEGRVKDRLLQPGTPVAISATDPNNPYEHVLVRGTVAARTTEGADQTIDSLARKYLDVDSYPMRREGEVRLDVVIQPD